ncbi:hypothetical protein KAR91_17250 [Candidatus Pacearchaeota archaeon]|nr:hypothetical protein [Candidatus Pacearchaeota archaeon]
MSRNALRKMFETDTAVERDGVWSEYAPGVEVRIARAGGSNKHFAKVMQRLAKHHRRAIQTESVDPDILRDIFIKAYAQAIIVDWKGFTKDLITHDDADSETELDFNTDNVEAVLRAQPNLFDDIQKVSETISYYRAEINEADSGNS